MVLCHRLIILISCNAKPLQLISCLLKISRYFILLYHCSLVCLSNDTTCDPCVAYYIHGILDSYSATSVLCRLLTKRINKINPVNLSKMWFVHVDNMTRLCLKCFSCIRDIFTLNFQARDFAARSEMHKLAFLCTSLFAIC